MKPIRTSPPGRGPAGRGADRGSSALEYLGFLPVLILIGLAGIQLGLIAYTAQQAGTGARAAARAASQEELRGSYEHVGKASMTGWVADRARIGPPTGGDTVTVRVTVRIPDVLLGLLGDRTVVKSATMPRDLTPRRPATHDSTARDFTDRDSGTHVSAARGVTTHDFTTRAPATHD
ncbi:TadE family protein [Streptomyces sp. NBC_01754]|uniref:TadE family protein n=1 Tax=Streptomyces sp. NBC_01754 TaxID=2975930 RepID=UPI002DDACAB2|nr:TadE family protein [Streptomyces sp. NBC_01754]